LKGCLVIFFKGSYLALLHHAGMTALQNTSQSLIIARSRKLSKSQNTFFFFEFYFILALDSVLLVAAVVGVYLAFIERLNDRPDHDAVRGKPVVSGPRAPATLPVVCKSGLP
jgi:hypothetical protein